MGRKDSRGVKSQGILSRLIFITLGFGEEKERGPEDLQSELVLSKGLAGRFGGECPVFTHLLCSLLFFALTWSPHTSWSSRCFSPAPAPALQDPELSIEAWTRDVYSDTPMGTGRGQWAQRTS